ncbi:Protein abrupt [Eumeta japonica]|uniref:Protein abrupt n=1 Tax=Eumeta variegata TaxID=151549 RepID=A0A4C1WM68_EUMVA|nr:Protein abrupt [Eumeta japonica]
MFSSTSKFKSFLQVVLSACSPYFRRLLKANPCQHPIVILRDVHDKDMESLLRFMYQGEVHIGQEQLKEFLRAAQLLQVRGLTDVPAPTAVPNLDQKASPQSASSSWTETGSGGSREGREPQAREGRRARRPDASTASTPPPKRARSSDLYNAQMKTRTEQLLAAQGGSPERLGSNGHELALLTQALDNAQSQHHLPSLSNNLSGEGEESSSDAGASDIESEPRTAKQEPQEYADDGSLVNSNGALPPNFPGLLNLPGFPGLAGPSGMHGGPDNFGSTWPVTGDPCASKPTKSEEGRYHPGVQPLPYAAKMDDYRPYPGNGACLVSGPPALPEPPGPETAPPARPVCPECGKMYSNNSNLKQHILNVHAAHELAHSCPICRKAFKTRQYMQIHMNSMHGVKQRRREVTGWELNERFTHTGA